MDRIPQVQPDLQPAAPWQCWTVFLIFTGRQANRRISSMSSKSVSVLCGAVKADGIIA